MDPAPETARREPWLFGDKVKEQIRQAVINRYRFLPYIYTVFFEASTQGMPVMRPVWMEFPAEEDLFAEEQTYMLGSALLVRPVVEEGKESVTFALPGQEPWYHALDGRPAVSQSWSLWLSSTPAREVTLPAPADGIVVLQRGGTIVPRRERVRRSSYHMRHDPFTLFAALDSSLQARGSLYLDDGETFAYRSGQCALRDLHVTAHSDGDAGSAVRRLVLFAVAGKIQDLSAEDQKASASSSRRLPTQAQLERVVLAGLPESQEGPQSVSVAVAAKRSSASSPVLSFPVPFVWDAETRRLTVKLQGHELPQVVSITSDFSLMVEL